MRRCRRATYPGRDNHLSLYGVNRIASKQLLTMITLQLMANVNLFLFYGVDGSGPVVSKVGYIDLKVVASLFNVLFFVMLLWASTREAAGAARGRSAFIVPATVSAVIVL